MNFRFLIRNCFLVLLKTFVARKFEIKIPLAFSPFVKQNITLEKILAKVGIMAENQISASGERRRCREIMTRNVTTATRRMSMREVAALMRDGDVGSLPVVEDGRLVGIVTDRDIVVRGVADAKEAATEIGEVMTTEIFSVRENDFVFEAIRLMGDKQVRRVPVINEAGELAGIIAMADVALETEDEREIAETLEEISSGAGFWKKG
jgi:CBS domain-containing protein